MIVLVDMNLSPAWFAHLERGSFSAIHWSTIGPFDASDSAIMWHARNRGMVVLTHDLDFGAILAATGAAGPSVVQIRADDLDPDVIGDRVVSALRASEPDLAIGALVTINPATTRTRILPFPNSNRSEST